MRRCLCDSFNDNEPRIEEVISQDISIGGLRFESKESLKLDSLILLKLGISDNDELVISGKVLWVKRINKELFSYGVKFNDIDTNDANKLKKILPDNFQTLSNEY